METSWGNVLTPEGCLCLQVTHEGFCALDKLYVPFLFVVYPSANKDLGCSVGAAGHRGTQALVWVKGARGADLNAEVYKGMNQGYSKEVLWKLILKFFLGRHSLLLPLNRIAACRDRKVEQASTKQHQETSPVWTGHVPSHCKSCRGLVNTAWILNTVGIFSAEWETVWNCPGRSWWFTKSSGILHSYI